MGHVYSQIADQLRSEGREHLTEKRQHDWARRFLRGIDLDSLCIKFSKAYTALLGNGHTGLYHADSLDQNRWPADMKRGIRPGTFRVVMTNPPFGQGLVKTGDVRREYDLARKWRRRTDGTWEMTDQIQKKQEIGILFLEYCLKLLEPGGRMDIVLLESYLGNQSDGYIPAWLLEKFTVLGVVDLPDTTFQPHTHAKTCVLFIENTPPPKAYNILMAAAQRVGHDNRGNTIYEEDARTSGRDLSTANLSLMTTCQRSPSSCGPSRTAGTSRKANTASRSPTRKSRTRSSSRATTTAVTSND